MMMCSQFVRVLRAIAVSTVVGVGIGFVPAANGEAVDGACCLDGGGCADLSDAACELGGGTFIGFDTSCASISCDLTGAPVFSGAALLLIVTLLLSSGLFTLHRRRARQALAPVGDRQR